MLDRPWCREERSSGGADLVLAVHAQPGAMASAVMGVHGVALRIRIAAPAVDGKANGELVRFLAAAFGVARANVTLLHGDSARRKLVRIAAPTLRPDREWK